MIAFYEKDECSLAGLIEMDLIVRRENLPSNINIFKGIAKRDMILSVAKNRIEKRDPLDYVDDEEFSVEYSEGEYE